MILDTNVLIDLLKGRKEAIAKLSELEEKGVVLSTTTISVFELYRGLREISNHEKITQISKLLESLDVYLFDKESARDGGMMLAKLEREGKGIDTEDTMIAGIAKTHQKKILTRDTNHFARIPDIAIETY
ncbi:MAG: PIN domain-containing protein [Candidatus Diapherotrites archaeon]|nr:PIN domain-containing protein [Candidatus Diapherotrites archaeon]MDZ4255985.1 PIN domain-containing protein [archaeon]